MNSYLGDIDREIKFYKDKYDKAVKEYDEKHK